MNHRDQLVESCNDTPCNTSDSHFENTSTVYHTSNHPLRVCDCVNECVCVWWVQITDWILPSIFICMRTSIGSVYDYMLSGERKMCLSVWDCESVFCRLVSASWQRRIWVYGGSMWDPGAGRHPAPVPRKQKEEISNPPPTPPLNSLLHPAHSPSWSPKCPRPCKCFMLNG